MNPDGRPPGIRETRYRAPRRDIKISPRCHPLVRFLIEEMIRQGMGITSFGEVSGFSFNTVQGWARGRTPRLHDLEAALNVLGHELWAVRIRAKQHDLSVRDAA
jgi:hypothetical protein